MHQTNIENLVSIGIATKNRWSDLQKTLFELSNSNLKSLSIYILDDASDTPCPFDIKQLCPNVSLKRCNESKGYIVRRNQLSRLVNTKYYLSLDDDSFPVQGSLFNAVRFAESQQKLLCISFQVFNPTTEQFENRSLGTTPYPVRSFIGCGHLLHRQNFLNLGGYREELIHQGEEMEISARGFLQELYCFHFPGFEIHHTASNQGRNWHRMDFYGARNNLLWNDWFVPEQLKWFQQSRTIGSRLALSLKIKRLGQIQGILSAFREIDDFQSHRHPFTVQQYQEWRKLPHS